MLVITISLLVSITGLAGVNLVRLQREHMSMALEIQKARRLARSAVELAHDKLLLTNEWRTAYASGFESTPFAPDGFDGNMSWRVSDSDGSFTNNDIQLRIDGIGRIGQTTQVISCHFKSVVGPTELRSFSALLGNSDDDLKNDKWWGQYLKPSLPGSATAYRVTSIQFYCRRIEREDFSVSIYTANAFNKPGTLIDVTSTKSDHYSTSWSWVTVPIAGSQWVDVANGICLTITTSSTITPLRLYYKGGGVFESNSAMLRGSPSGWNSVETNKAIWYKVQGEYRTNPADIDITPGSFHWGAAP
ncbi:hypothetical protein [Rubinisphaera margarita]|uniref:hypothetical protein n=1 Tax=Rubinisphaera margarita TaxID=2909586 RepID=UPI001EE92259|nr:hypothetical protein [Rubinisphaera margarita]MCG6155845.1 hypothetical protein [Rubinisphaera margarita]